jgi:predicted RNA-binding Zn-ribbon protein involved in translation (DUF1610 family)
MSVAALDAGMRRPSTPTAIDRTATDRPPTRKAVLFCPDCGRASHVDGDWRRTDVDDGTTWTCPACETVIETRPAFDTPTHTSRLGFHRAVTAPLTVLRRALALE